MSSTRLPPRFTFGATRFHFQSERHSVSMSTPPRRNGPLRQGMNCLRVSARTSGSSTGLPAIRMPSSMRHPVSVWGRESIAAFHFGMSPWRPGLSASLHWRSRYAAGSGSKKEKIWDMGWLVIWLFGYLVIWLFGWLVDWLGGWVVEAIPGLGQIRCAFGLLPFALILSFETFPSARNRILSARRPCTRS